MNRVTNEMVAAGAFEINHAVEGLPEPWRRAAAAMIAYLPDIYRAMRALESAPTIEHHVYDLRAGKNGPTE